MVAFGKKNGLDEDRRNDWCCFSKIIFLHYPEASDKYDVKQITVNNNNNNNVLHLYSALYRVSKCLTKIKFKVMLTYKLQQYTWYIIIITNT